MLSFGCSYGIKMTADRFLPGNQAIIISLFKSAFNQSVWLSYGVGANFVVFGKSWCYPAEFIIVSIFPLFFNFIYGIGSEIGFYLFVILLHQMLFFLCKRSSCITLLTTTTLACIQIAYKLL